MIQDRRDREKERERNRGEERVGHERREGENGDGMIILNVGLMDD